jgi:hypothetical protein
MGLTQLLSLQSGSGETLRHSRAELSKSAACRLVALSLGLVDILGTGITWHGSHARVTWHGSLGTGHMARVTWHGSHARVTWHGSHARVTWHGSHARVKWHGSHGTGHMQGSHGTGHMARVTWHGSHSHMARVACCAVASSCQLACLEAILQLLA